MNQPIQHIPTPQTLESILNGARLMVIKIDEDKYIRPKITVGEYDPYVCSHCGHIANPFKDELKCVGCYDELLLELLPLKQGDDIYIAEDYLICEREHDGSTYVSCDMDKTKFHFHAEWQPASEMTYEQSRLRFTVGEVSVKKVIEIVISEAEEITKWKYIDDSFFTSDWNDWLKSQDIEPTDTVALYELTDKEK